MTYPTAEGTPDPYNLIETALSSGEIDVDHAAVYRLFALFGDPRLPNRYQSDRLIQADGLGAFMFAMKDFDRVSPATLAFQGGYTTPRKITVVPTAVHPSPTSTPTWFPHGFYALTVVTPTQAGGLALSGQWRMDLSAPDQAQLWLGRKLVITRLYRSSGKVVEFSDEYGSYACNDQGGWASYEWSFSAGALTLTKTQDGCDLRAALLQASGWIQQ